MSEVRATIQRSYRIRVYPTAVQRAQLARWLGAARWVWNHALERRSKAYRRRGESMTGTDVSRTVTALKRTRRYCSLNEVPASVLVQKLRDPDQAFANFFASRAQYPRFRKRADHTEVLRLWGANRAEWSKGPAGPLVAVRCLQRRPQPQRGDPYP